MEFRTTNGQEASTLQVTVSGDAAATATYVTGKFWSYDAVFDLPISGQAKLAYLNLCRRAGGKNGTTYVSQEKIARDCGMSRSSVQRALRELAPVGAVHVRSRKAQGLSNLYCPTPPNLWRGGCVTQTQGCATQTQGCVGGTHKGSPSGKTLQDSLSAQEEIPSNSPLSTPLSQQDEPLPNSLHTTRDSSVPPPQASSQTLDLPLVEKSIETFYQNLGQPKVSSQKIKDGVKTVADLKKQGFPLVDILFGMSWITTHPHQFKKPVYSLGLLPRVIGQALASRINTQPPTDHTHYSPEECQHLAAYHRQQERYRQRESERQADLKRQQEYERLYQALSSNEQAALREVAIKGLLKQGVKEQMLLDSVVKAQVYCLLGERHQDNNLGAATMTAQNHQAHTHQSH